MTSDSRAGLIDAESFAADSPRTGFETIMTLANDAKYVRVAAMDFRGTLLGVSPVLDVANDEMIIDDMYTEIHGTHKPDGDAIHIDTHPGRTDKSGNGFPSWLMGVIAAAVVICLILAMYVLPHDSLTITNRTGGLVSGACVGQNGGQDSLGAMHPHSTGRPVGRACHTGRMVLDMKMPKSFSLLEIADDMKDFVMYHINGCAVRVSVCDTRPQASSESSICLGVDFAPGLGGPEQL